MNAGAAGKWEFDAHHFSEDEVREAFCVWGFGQRFVCRTPEERRAG